jgi:two-component system, OmpR family, response regulator QseB
VVRRVLVVEDDRLVSETIRTAFLMKGGFEVDCAEDGEAGLAALADGNLDLALVDYGLPKVPGLIVAKRALARNIPTILMTGYGDEIAKLEEDQFPVLAKPFSVAELVAGFDQIVAEARRLNELAQRLVEQGFVLNATHQVSSDEWLRICERLRRTS